MQCQQIYTNMCAWLPTQMADWFIIGVSTIDEITIILLSSLKHLRPSNQWRIGNLFISRKTMGGWHKQVGIGISTPHQRGTRLSTLNICRGKKNWDDSNVSDPLGQRKSCSAVAHTLSYTVHHGTGFAPSAASSQQPAALLPALPSCCSRKK